MRENVFTSGSVYSSSEICSVYDVFPKFYSFNKMTCKPFDLPSQDAFCRLLQPHISMCIFA